MPAAGRSDRSDCALRPLARPENTAASAATRGAPLRSRRIAAAADRDASETSCTSARARTRQPLKDYATVNVACRQQGPGPRKGGARVKSLVAPASVQRRAARAGTPQPHSIHARGRPGKTHPVPRNSGGSRSGSETGRAGHPPLAPAPAPRLRTRSGKTSCASSPQPAVPLRRAVSSQTTGTLPVPRQCAQRRGRSASPAHAHARNPAGPRAGLALKTRSTSPAHVQAVRPPILPLNQISTSPQLSETALSVTTGEHTTEQGESLIGALLTLADRAREAEHLRQQVAAAEVAKARIEGELSDIREDRERERKAVAQAADREAALLKREAAVDELVAAKRREEEEKLAREKQQWMEDMKAEVRRQWEAVEAKCQEKELAIEDARRRIAQLESQQQQAAHNVPPLSETDGCGKTTFFARLSPRTKMQILTLTGVPLPPHFSATGVDEGKTRFFARLPGAVKVSSLRGWQASKGGRDDTAIAAPSKRVSRCIIDGETQRHYEALDDELDELLAAASSG